jgi:oligoribonuclease
MREAEEKLLRLVRQHVPARTAPLAGSSVWTDRIYLRRLMPELEAHLYYRCVDVSSIKEMLERWKPDLTASFEKRRPHRAMDDIRESIAELKHYRGVLGF